MAFVHLAVRSVEMFSFVSRKTYFEKLNKQSRQNANYEHMPQHCSTALWANANPIYLCLLCNKQIFADNAAFSQKPVNEPIQYSKGPLLIIMDSFFRSASFLFRKRAEKSSERDDNTMHAQVFGGDGFCGVVKYLVESRQNKAANVRFST